MPGHARQNPPELDAFAAPPHTAFMQASAPFAILLPAAGTGSRFAAGDKLLADLDGQSVLQRSAALFARRPEVAVMVIVTAPERFTAYRRHLESSNPALVAPFLDFAGGGRERWESVLLGLRHIAGLRLPALTHVAVHDAARPLTPASVIDRAFATALAGHAAVPCVPEPATLKRIDAGGTIAATVDRRGLYQAQTPQCFHLNTLLGGYEKLLAAGALDATITDDAQILEKIGLAAPMTPGDPRNLKITTPADLILARALLRDPPEPKMEK